MKHNYFTFLKTFFLVFLCLITSTYIVAQSFTEDPNTTFVDITYSSIAFVDVDNDGDNDLMITGNGGSGGLKISKLYSNNGTGTFTEVIGNSFEGVNIGSIGFADIDADSDQDLLITGYDNDRGRIAKLYTNNGSGIFTEVIGTPFTGVANSSMAFSDIDGDGDQDVLITGDLPDASTGSTKLYTNNGTGTFTEVLDTPFDDVYRSSVAFSDIDGDGDQDVLITGAVGSPRISISKLYTNNGSGVFTEVTGTPFEGVHESFVAFEDLDNDGDQDVVITGLTSSSRIAKLYTNNGAGVFMEVLNTPFLGVENGSLAFSDIDLDGDKDVVITGFSKYGASTVSYRNFGNNSFAIIRNNPFVDVFHSSIAYDDVDEDGDEDLLITGRLSTGQFNTKLYINELVISIIWYQDSDGDSFGNPDVSIESPTQPVGYVADNTDCDDTDEAVHEETTWYLDFDSDNYAISSVISCASPGEGYTTTELPITDCDDNDPTIYPGAPEIPGNDIDEDCDGEDTLTWYEDSDGDSFGNPDESMESPTQPVGYVADNTDCDDTDATVHLETTWYLDFDSDNYAISSMISCGSPGEGYTKTEIPITDCDDNDPTIYPGAPEIPGDGIDQDCDGEDTLIWYEDNDGDNYGNPDISMESPTQPVGYVADNTDCDDMDATVHQETTWYLDFDGDNYAISSMISCVSPGEGYTTTELLLTDCNDSDPTIYPGAPEIPGDGIDQDCDGEDTLIWYEDKDGDSFGNPDVSMESPIQPEGYVADNTDCDDTDATVNQEVTWYLDFDGDNYAISSMISCASPGQGYTTTELPITDCNDNDPTIYPGAVEIPNNGIDEDCDGEDLNDGGETCANDIFGNLNLNPARSANNIFIMETPGGIIDMNTLASGGSNYNYYGSATLVKIKVKAQGRTLTVNGSKITLRPNIRYEFTGSLNISLTNKLAGGNNKRKANGHWWLGIDGQNICITEYKNQDDYSKNDKQNVIYKNKVTIYPNRFSDYCSISYSLNKEANVNIRIYDLNNRLIKKLNVSNSNKGEHIVKWDGTNDHGRPVKDGIYIVQFKTYDHLEAYKVILNRE